MLKTTANKITLFRIVLIPVFLLLCYSGHTNWAFAVYITACLSDFADGYIARHYHQITDWGKFMDPLADKMLVLAAMCFFVECHTMPGWVVAVVLFREFAVSGLRLVAVEQRGRGTGPRDRGCLVRQDQDGQHDGRAGAYAAVRRLSRS